MSKMSKRKADAIIEHYRAAGEKIRKAEEEAEEKRTRILKKHAPETKAIATQVLALLERLEEIKKLANEESDTSELCYYDENDVPCSVEDAIETMQAVQKGAAEFCDSDE